MDLQLTGKRALVVGGNGGIGKPIAAELLREGADVVIAGHTDSRLQDAARDLRGIRDREVLALRFDIREDVSVSEMVEHAASNLGGIDILINTGAPQDRGQLKWDQVTTAPFLADLNVKALGYLRCAQRAAPYMIKSGWGRIINIAGLNVRHSGSLMGAVRNSAVAGVTKNLADELGPLGINVTVVHPGSVSTEREPRRGNESSSILGRHIEGYELAWVVTFLASPRSVAITGDAIAVGGGEKGVVFY